MPKCSRRYSLAFLAFLPFFGSAPPFALQGVVVDSAGRPVAAAEVALHLSARQFSAGRSDARGRFLVLGLGEPAAEIEARHPDFALFRLALSENPAELYRLVLQRKVVVEGRLLDDLGRPVAGAGLTLRHGGALLATTTSSAEGLFVFEDLPAQKRLSLAVEATGFATSERNFSSAEARVSLGDWILAEGHLLRRQVVDASGQNVVGARIYLLHEESLEAQRLELEPQTEPIATTNGDGIFVLDGLPERLRGRLQIRAPGYLPLQLREPRVHDIEDPLQLGTAPILNGAVRDEEGNPVEGAIVVLAPADASLPEYFGAQGRTTPQGEFSLSLITTGPRRLKVESLWHLPVERTLDIPEGGQTGIEIQLRAGFRIRGKILAADGTSAAGAGLLWRSESEPGSTQLETADEAGHFELYPLRPGLGKLLAQHPALGMGEFDLDLTQDLTDLEFRLSERSPGELSLLLLDDADQPVIGVEVEIRPEDFGVSRRTTSDKAGKARFEALPKGTYRLQIKHNDFLLSASSLPHDGIEVERIVRLERACVIAGQVLGLSPRDLEQTRIVVEQGEGRFHGSIHTGNASFRVFGLRVGPLKVILRRPGSEDIERALVLERPGQILNLTLP